MAQIPKRSSVSPRNPFLLSCGPPLPLEVCLNLCPLSRWCYLTISPSVTPFSSCLQSFTASGSFPINLLFTSGGPSIGTSASVLPMNIQGWLPLFKDWLVWSPCCPRYSEESSSVSQLHSINSLELSFLYGPILISIYFYWKNNSFD